MHRLKEDIGKYNRRSLFLLVYLVATAVVLLANAMSDAVTGSDRPIVILALLAVTIAITSARHPLQFHGTVTAMLVSDALTFLAIVLFGPSQGALLAAVEPLLASRRMKLRPSLYLFNISEVVISAYAAGHVYEITGRLVAAHPIEHGIGQTMLAFSLPLATMALAFYLINAGLIALMSWLTYGTTLAESLLPTLPWDPLTYLADALAAGIVAYGAAHYGPIAMLVTVTLTLPVPILVYYMFKTYRDKLAAQHLHYQELAEINDSILEMLAMAIDAKDQVTHDHIQRVKFFGKRMGQLLGLSEPEIEAVKAGALLHDIGKIGVPAYILNKPGKLTEHEFEQMKMHTIIGADMLSNINFRFPVVPIVRHHHERWDGKGYPDGLSGEEIPLTARILTLIDSYDAIRSDRPYHKAMTRTEAVDYVRQNAGTYFDPQLVDLFLSNIDQLEADVAQLLSDTSGEQASHRKAGDKGKSGQLVAARPANGLESAPPVDRAAAALLRVAESNQRVSALFEMSRTLAGSLTVEDAVAILTNRLSKLIPFTTCAISLFDPNKSEFEIVHAIGRHAEVFARRRIPVNAGITGWVIQNQRPMFNTNPVLDLGFLDAADSAEYKAVLVFPLVKHQQALGAIALYSTELETYPSEYIQLIESISQPVSDSIHNALAFEQAQRAALTDPVTGLANMKSFSGQFERETARSRRSGMPLSVMVATVVPISTTPTPTDWEQAMASIGELIRHCLRETDLIARQGRNSFVALLPDSGRVESAEVIARVQAAISPETASVISLTMTFGTSPDDGETIEDLTRAAASRGVLRASGITDQLNLPTRASFPASSAGA